MNTVHEPGRDLPVVREVDVLVVGGGTAGIAAGVAAARNGAETLVVERYNCLGGQMTAGYVVFIPGTWNYDVGSPTFGGLMTEIVTRLRQENAFWRLGGKPDSHPWFDPEVMKWLGIDLLENAGARLRLHSWVSNVILDGPRISAVVVESKEGRQAIVAKSVVDASGDADLAFFSGATYETGTKRISLEGRVLVQDVDAYREFVEKNREALQAQLDANGIRASFGPRMHALAPGLLLSSCAWPGPDSMAGEYDGVDVDVLTMIETESRKAYKKMVDFYRANVLGCKDMVLLETSSQLGVRETRRATGDHILTMQEVGSRTRFQDCIGRSGVPDRYFEIPYRSIYSKDVDNLWVAGRCISADHEAQGRIRIIPPCVLTGEAAGTAAAIAAREGVASARELDTNALVDQLLKQGVALRDQTARLP